MYSAHPMKVLFIHQNFPGQYLHLARYLGADPDNQVVFITQRQDASLPGVRNIVYKPQRAVTPGIHHYLRDVESGVLNAQAITRIALDLKKSGFVPDVILGHNGWGEIWYIKDVFPRTPLLGYFEFFYQLNGADVGFDTSVEVNFDSAPRIRTKNVGNLLGLEASDIGQCPTQWQKSRYPLHYQDMLHVVHEGINTAVVVPNAQARLSIPNSVLVLTKDDEVLTYVARNLEPYRGFHSFMRSLPAILKARPNAHVVIVGGDETSYGPGLPEGQTFRQKMLDELGSALDHKRVHFLGRVPYPIFLTILQVSRVHVYLTYPFVLSWSVLEAMSAGCLVIGSNTAPVEEVIRDGENGLLVDFFSHVEIAEKVNTALAHRDSFASMRKNARQTIVEQYDLTSICLPAQLKLLEMAIELKTP
jgi:glycosyltransferase involved in cell wall biosynthesis